MGRLLEENTEKRKGATMNQSERSEKANQRIDLLPIQIKRDEAALLLNLLSDNARLWNAGLRKRLDNFVTPTEAYLARVMLSGR
jgi:hypothetical protein